MLQRSRSWHTWPPRVIGVLQDLHTKVTANAAAQVEAVNAGHQQETLTASDASANPAIKNDVANARSPSAEISSLASQIASSDWKLTAARAAREQEAKDFSKSETPLLDVVDSLQRGISVIQKETAKKKIDTRTINNVVAALTPVVDTTAFECRQPEVGG